MDTQNDARNSRPSGEFIRNVNVLKRNITAKWVFEATTLDSFLKKVAAENPPAYKVLRRGGIRGQHTTTPLPPGALWRRANQFARHLAVLEIRARFRGRFKSELCSIRSWLRYKESLKREKSWSPEKAWREVSRICPDEQRRWPLHQSRWNRSPGHGPRRCSSLRKTWRTLPARWRRTLPAESRKEVMAAREVFEKSIAAVHGLR